jgi:hypothetical protein
MRSITEALQRAIPMDRYRSKWGGTDIESSAIIAIRLQVKG